MTDSSLGFSHEIDFSGLVLGFSSAALHYLGEQCVDSAQAMENNALARQNIDILELLSKKTKGNLSKEEQTLIDTVLRDLHLKYLDKTSGKTKK